jgi:mRNA interferase YafQ
VAKYNPVRSSRFRKDVMRCFKRGLDITALETIMEKLENDEPLDPDINRPHCLQGTNPKIIECHIASDWLLEYRYDGNDIYYIATGSHSDLF